MQSKTQLSPYINDNTPAFATLIIKNKETVFKDVSGSAVLENGKCVKKATVDTPFAICSLTKHFTSAAILMLEEDGLLSTNDEISQYIPQLSTDFAGIRIKHLIFFISGVPNYTEIPGILDISSGFYKNGAVLDHGRIIDLILKSKPTGFSESFAYSNSGYILLTEIIQNVSGLPFAAFLQERIFDRFNMTNSFLIADIDQHKNYTHQYNPWPLFTPTNWINTFHLSGDGGLFMSINDYEKWIRAFDQHLIFQKKLTMEKYLSAGRFDDGRDITNRGTKSGFGLAIYEEKQNNKTYKVIAASGMLPGAASFFKRFSNETDDIWVVYFNNGGSYPDVFDILDQANISY